MTLAMFYSLCSAFGLELELRPYYTKFIIALEDDFYLKKSMEFLNNSEEPIAIQHRGIIQGILPTIFIKHKDPRFRIEKFRHILSIEFEKMNDLTIGAFMMNVYSGTLDQDIPIYTHDLIKDHLNIHVAQLFSFINKTFTVENELSTMMLTGYSTNVWNYLIWRGKKYQGEIDNCLLHLT